MAKWPYDSPQWRKLRRLKLDDQPMCEDCEQRGQLVLANVVDHRVAISQGGDPFPALDGLASLCPSCHSAKTMRGKEAGVRQTNKPRRGCTADGRPLDHRHPWHDRFAKSERRRRTEQEISQS